MFRRIVEINVLSVLVLCFLLVSCKFTELIFYEHEPSKLFYESYDMDKPELDGFTEDGVLFVIDIRAAMNEEYFLWLGLYSKNKDKRILIKNAAIFSGDDKELSVVDRVLLVDEPVDNTNLYQNPADTLKLFEADKA